MIPVFITGIGTDVGKTLVAAIITKALGAAYWKPVQAGGLDNTDAHIVRNLAGKDTRIFEESYLLQKPASPHISAREEGLTIDLNKIAAEFGKIDKQSDTYLVIEAAGGLLVPLNETQTVADLAKTLDVPVIIVSRNYLGSINHSLMTAACCKQNNLRVAGWIFTDEFMGYEEEICHRSGLPLITKIPFLASITEEAVAGEAKKIRHSLAEALKNLP